MRPSPARQQIGHGCRWRDQLQPSARVVEWLALNEAMRHRSQRGTLFRSEGDALRTVAMHGAPQPFPEARQRDPILRPGLGSTLKRALTINQQMQIGDVCEEDN